MPETVVETHGLHMRRGEQAFTLPDIRLLAGETLALSGPSGSGKTSLLLALAGLVRPKGGEVRLQGQSMWNLSESGRARLRGQSIGYVFADFRLIDSLSVMDNLQMARASAHLRPDSQRAKHLLDRLNIPHLSDRRADRLSQGQAQRVALARALMNRPPLLLADEPTAALDEDNGRDLMALLLSLTQEEGAAALIATHDKRLFAQLGGVAFVTTKETP